MWGQRCVFRDAWDIGLSLYVGCCPRHQYEWLWIQIGYYMPCLRHKYSVWETLGIFSPRVNICLTVRKGRKTGWKRFESIIFPETKRRPLKITKSLQLLHWPAFEFYRKFSDLADMILILDGKHLVNTKYLVSMKIFTDSVGWMINWWRIHVFHWSDLLNAFWVYMTVCSWEVSYDHYPLSN